MDSDSSSRSGGGDRRGRSRDSNSNRPRRSSSGGSGRNRSNRNRNRKRRSGSSSSSRSSGGGDTYRPRGSGSESSPPKKKPGLLGKIVSFFKGEDPPNKGTGRPIQTKRKRPGMTDAPAAGESRPGKERTDRRSSEAGGGDSRSPRSSDGDRPKRKRSRSRNRRRKEDGEGSSRNERGGGGDSGRGSGNRRNRRGGRDGDRDRNRRGGRGGRGPAREERQGDDRQPRAKREPRVVEVSSGRLYIGNLDYNVTDEELEDLFKGFGNVVSAEIVTNQKTDRSKGFAFVEMSTIEEARRAVEILHDKDFMGRKITVTGAKSDGPVDPENPPAKNDSGDNPDDAAESSPDAAPTGEAPADSPAVATEEATTDAEAPDAVESDEASGRTAD